jgi:hypothetical protein
VIEPEVLVALRALADPLRLRVAGRVASSEADAGTIATDLDLAHAGVERALASLERAGLVHRTGNRWAFNAARLREIGRALAGLEGAQPAVPPLTAPSGRILTPAESKVVRSFVVEGRLVSIPAREGKREVILDWLLDSVFIEDREYPEAEVNQRLGIFHRDVASLRRYLVDTGRVTRERGLYRRVPARSLVPPSASGV